MRKKHNIGRRTLLKGAVRTGFFLTAGASPYLLAAGLNQPDFSRFEHPEKRLFRYDYNRPIRPPGAVNEHSFPRACIQCGNCGQACPVRAIRFFGVGGGRMAHTPYIQPELKGCILCQKCPPVCPSGALRPLAPEAVRMGKAMVDRKSCYPWVDGGICGACVSICPLGEQAIGFQFAGFYRPIVNQGCVGCGVCVEICPHPAKAIRIVPDAERASA